MTADELAELHRAATGPREAWTAQDFSAHLTQDTALLVTAPGSFCLGRVAAGEGEILMLATHPGLRRQGLARTLLSRFLDRARRRDAERVFLEVGVSNMAARRLYQTAGFKEVGRRKAYYRSATGPEDAVVMRCDLTQG